MTAPFCRGSEDNLVDEALPGVAAVVAQRDGSAARNAREGVASGIAEAIHDGIVRIADRGAQPDVPVLVLELDVIAVPISENARLALLFFQVEESARQLFFLAQSGVDHDGRGYYRIHYVVNNVPQR